MTAEIVLTARRLMCLESAHLTHEFLNIESTVSRVEGIATGRFIRSCVSL